MKIFKILLISIFLFLILPVCAQATDYYVDATDGNDSYNGLYPIYESGSNGPWLTLAKSVSGVSSGDTVYLRGGTWQDEQLHIGGKHYTSTTTWKAYPGEAPVIDMRNSGTSTDARGIYIKLSDNVYIDGITVRNSGHKAINASGCNNLTITNSTTEHSRLAGIYVSGCDDFEVSYNTVKWTQCAYTDHDHDTWTSFSQEVISIAESSTNGDVHHNSISHGTTGNGGGEGLNIKNGASYIYVHHNDVDLLRDDGLGNRRYCMGVDGWTTETHHIYFYNNIVRNCYWGIQFNSEEGGYTHHLYAWNNIIINIGLDRHGGGIGFPRHGGSPGVVEYSYFWNNIIYDSYYGFMGEKEELGNGENYVQNNIFYNSVQADTYFPVSNPDDITFDHNLFSETDPKFVNASGGDFHLMPDSPAIDAGVIVPNVTDDFDGIARPQGAGYDIGAYEYLSGAPPADTTPPSTPTNLTATAVSSSQINLSWSASTDNVGVTGYRIYRDGSQIATTTNTSYSNTGLSASTTYSYTVSAYDAANNESSQSSSASATTSAPSDTTPPTRSNGSPSGELAAGTTQTNLSLTTNESATCRYSISSGTSYSSMSNTFTTTGGTSHSTTATGLSDGQSYTYYIRCQDTVSNANIDDYLITFSVAQTPTLSVSLSANPSLGNTPLSGVDFTATVSGNVIGTINYTFYCNRADSGTNITTPYDGKYDNISQTTYTATDVCTYNTAGTYTAKVIAERGAYQAEARLTITVSSAATDGNGDGGGGGTGEPTPTPTPEPSPTITAKPEDYGLKEGNLIRAQGDFDIFIINQHGYKRLFLNPAIFEMYGHLGSWDDVITVTPETRDAFITSSHYRFIDEDKVYHMEVAGEDTGTLRWLNMTANSFSSQGGTANAIFTINKSELDWYPKGMDRFSL